MRRPFDVSQLPLDDRTVEELPTRVRGAVSRHWQRRARSELRIGRAFSAMVLRMDALGGHPRVRELLVRAADDEARHGAICLALAAHYAGDAIPRAEVGEVPLPHFGCDDQRLEMALLVAGTCCINETLATAYIEAALSASTAPVAAAANRLHLREEIDHARLGWAHLATIDDDVRHALGASLVRLLESNVPLWERPDPHLPAEGVPGHGLPGTAATRDTVARALSEVVIPGFAHVGVDITAAKAWLAIRPSPR